MRAAIGPSGPSVLVERRRARSAPPWLRHRHFDHHVQARRLVVDDREARRHRRAAARRSRGRRRWARAGRSDGCARACRRAARPRAAPARCARHRAPRRAPSCTMPVGVERADEADFVAAGEPDRGADARRRGATREACVGRSRSARSRLARLLLRGREEHVVEDQPVAGRVRVQREVGGRAPMSCCGSSGSCPPRNVHEPWP